MVANHDPICPTALHFGKDTRDTHRLPTQAHTAHLKLHRVATQTFNWQKQTAPTNLPLEKS
jgi:hypothetical protein